MVGGGLVAYKFIKGPNIEDANFLVEVGMWTEQDDNTVIWNFTEIGKGTLTTNAHINDYDFIWAIEGKDLKIETSWLYALNDNFSYKLDQGKKTLTLTRDDEIYTFVPFEPVTFPGNIEEIE